MMADFAEVIKVAQEGYSNRDDYPPYALASWDDRTRWTAYLKKINEELEKQHPPEASPQAR